MTIDRWDDVEASERYVGRWSRLVAAEFLDWLKPAPGLEWIEVGCGWGALSEQILAKTRPNSLLGFDLSADYIEGARKRLPDPRARFQVADARKLDAEDGEADLCVSALLLNFVPNPIEAVREAARVVSPRGTVAGYVWDYAGDMQMMRKFWDAAVALDPSAREKDEATRFPLCNPGPLEALFREAGLKDVEVKPIDVPTRFSGFDDYWEPFLAGMAPAPGYNMSLPEGKRAELREKLRGMLPAANDGSITLSARAWAVRGKKG